MINFHRFLIGTAILFCAVFALWAQRAYQSDGAGIYRFMSAGFGGGAVLLAYYLANLRRFLGRR